MNTRIRQVRKSSGKNQDQFAESIGLTKNYISLLENGDRIPSDRTISDICRVYGVNEEWLRSGTGPMLRVQTEDESLAAFFGEVLADKPGYIRRRFLRAASRMTDEDWQWLDRKLDELLQDKQKDPGE